MKLAFALFAALAAFQVEHVVGTTKLRQRDLEGYGSYSNSMATPLKSAMTNTEPAPKPVADSGDGGKPVCELELREPITAVQPLVNTIMEIQGSELTSSFVGQTVFRVPGIVTAIMGTEKFFMQDLEGDGDDSTSDAIVVTWTGTPPLSVGDIVSVTGIVDELILDADGVPFSQPVTLIDSSEVDIVSSGNALPSPVLIGAQGRNPPTESMVEGVHFWESLEAMYVEVDEPVSISPRLNEGLIYMVSDCGEYATGLNERGDLVISENDYNPEIIRVEDDMDVFDLTFQDLSVGTKFSNILGVMYYDNGNYEVIPTEHFGISTPSNLEPTTTTCQKSPYTMSVATYNLDQLGNSLVGLPPALPDPIPAEFLEVANHIVNNMGAPDIVALQDARLFFSGGPFTLGVLVEAIKQIDPTMEYKYEFVVKPDIAVANENLAFLYNPWRISTLDDEATEIISTGPEFLPEGSMVFRNAIVSHFKFLPLQKKFDAINIHFSERIRGGSVTVTDAMAAIMGVNQPINELQEAPQINALVDERLLQSNEVRKYIEGRRMGGFDSFIVLGTANDLEWISPVVNLDGSPLKNLIDGIPQEERYNNIWHGNAQAIDYILVSEDLCPGTTGEYVHVSAEFAGSLTHDPMVGCVVIPHDY